MIMKRASVSDAKSLASLEKLCFSHPWSEQSLRDSLSNPDNYFYFIEKDGIIVGYIGFNKIIDEGYIYNVAVHPDFRRKGLGRALVDYVIKAHSSKLAFLTLEVRPSNTPAIELYRSFGFKKAGERRDYYSNPTEDALLLTLNFN